MCQIELWAYIFHAFIDLFQTMSANFPQKYRQKRSQTLHVHLTMSVSIHYNVVFVGNNERMLQQRLNRPPTTSSATISTFFPLALSPIRSFSFNCERKFYKRAKTMPKVTFESQAKKMVESILGITRIPGGNNNKNQCCTYASYAFLFFPHFFSNHACVFLCPAHDFGSAMLNMLYNNTYLYHAC